MLLPSIAFVGPAGSGKSTAAGLLADHYKYNRLSFAMPLKKVAGELWSQPGREEYQQLGEKVREIHEDTWCDLLEAQLRRQLEIGMQSSPHGTVRFTVDDCRFPNEHEMLKGNGFKFIRLTCLRSVQTVRLTANGKWQDGEQLDHISEHALDGVPTDAYIDTSDLDDFGLWAEVIVLLGKWQIR